MANGNTFDTRAAVLDLLLDKVNADEYPSETMMDLIEQLMEPDDIPTYAAVLMAKVSGDNFPSISMLRRLVALGSAAS
jgi:hypothetical protein